ncbi:MAG: hypothetical protein U1F52_07130 [Burkholderiales bacterium]
MSAAFRNMTGDVLQVIAILGRSAQTLERIIGFHSGRLARGYEIWFLDDTVGPDDFEWGRTTRFPGNWARFSRNAHDDPSEQYARVEDLERWRAYRASGFDAARADASFDGWKLAQAALLNDRSPDHRIVKVVPLIPHDPKMAAATQYPKAAGRAISQWKLRRPKRFVFGARIGPGGRYLGGGSGAWAVSGGTGKTP